MQAIYDIAELCSQLGVKHAVLSPGSRCAPLTISFAQHPKIKEITISDERSAAFIGLGLAQASSSPVVLICTSGSALLNYSPAVAEAFYSEIPLIVLSADRPLEWIDQQDGQAIHQQNIYGKHVKASFQLPVDSENNDSAWDIKRKVCEAINISLEGKKGPVHINIPFREPFYPETKIGFSNLTAIQNIYSSKQINGEVIDSLQKQLDGYSKILIVAGQGNYSQELSRECEKLNAPIIKETISNFPKNKNTVTQIDNIFLSTSEDILPDLVISFGQSVLSKGLKTKLRQHNFDHWHIQNHEGSASDTFQHLTKVIKSNVLDFFAQLKPRNDDSFLQSYKTLNRLSDRNTSKIIENQNFSEFKALQLITDTLPQNTQLHLANSMAVRYSNLYPSKNEIKTFANRGTSGIDGSSSTCVGVSIIDSEINTLFTGDLSFFYDSNAFWNNYIGENLRIVVFNNNGGGIFRMIDGPAKQKELEPYFVTEQKLSARKIAELHDLEYSRVNTTTELTEALNTFFEEGNSKILEIFTDGHQNTTLFKEYKKEMNKIINS